MKIFHTATTKRAALGRIKNLYWTGFVYFIGLCAFGVPWWQAGLVATVAFTCWYLSYCRAALAGIGIVVLFAGLGTWVGLIPHWH
jgi:hypothetical protein